MSANPRADKFSMDKIHRRERFADFAYTLARINWDFFTHIPLRIQCSGSPSVKPCAGAGAGM
jgi:hypothetical protein